MTTDNQPEQPQKDGGPIYHFTLWFQKKIAVLQLSDGQKSAMSAKLTEEFRADAGYWAEIILSTIIATLGLLQNSVAIVIGAMLIAPLFRPIQLIAFGITTGQSSNVIRGLRVLLASVLVSVGIGFLVTQAVPLRTETTEILARVAPNLLDFFIALASGVVVFLALSSTRFSESVAGVAMSAALLPPLAVAGVEFAFQNFEQASGSLFLFATNLIAIILVGIVMFFLYGYAPHQRFKRISTFKNVIILLFLAGIITIPLLASLQNIADQIEIKSRAKSYLEIVLTETIPNAKLETLEVQGFTAKTAKLFGSIKIPQGAEFFVETKNSITEQLGTELQRDVDLQLDIIPVANIVSKEEQTEELAPNQELAKQFRQFVKQELAQASLISLDIISVGDNNTPPTEWAIKAIITLPTGEDFSEQLQQDLSQRFASQVDPQQANIAWTVIPQYVPPEPEPEPTAAEQYQKELNLQFDNFFNQNLGSNATIDNLQIRWQTKDGIPADADFSISNISTYSVKFDLYLPTSDQAQIPEFEQRIDQFADDVFAGKPSTFKFRTFSFQLEQVE